MSIPKAIIRNEEHRWSYMTEPVLERRLKKITNVNKLRAFAEQARVYGCNNLRKEAEAKIVLFNA